MRILFLLFLLFPCQYIFSQVRLQGIVTDSLHNSIDHAQLILYQDASNQILDYTSSQSNGGFIFNKLFPTGIYRLEANRLGYNKFIQKLIIATDSSQSINFSVILNQNNSSQLQEVIVTIQQPIIVKKDTIIYDITQFMNHQDETLEAVLARIQGFKIHANGDIEVNGKIINKVLVDGKEISDFGGSLITNSLSPEKVASVEVRFDEKNNKIKESLLSDKEFVVLDIKLKETVNKKFFGKQQFTAGYQEKVQIGGLSNYFSLKGKTNTQVFGENNNFGRNIIQIDQIRNLGDESISQLFSLPIDIEDAKKRENFQEEIYGFDNYTQNDNAIFGLSINKEIGPNTDLYFGSFNNYQFLKNQFQSKLYFNNFLINSFQSNNQLLDENSKNKIQLKHTKDQLKINLDLNYVFQNKGNLNKVSDTSHYSYQNENQASNFYLNNKVEYELSPNIGVSNNFSFVIKNIDYLINLEGSRLPPNSEFSSFIYSNKLDQTDNNRLENFNNRLNFTIQSSIFGQNSLGFNYSQQNLKNSKTSNFIEFNSTYPFSNRTIKKSIIHEISHGIGPVYLSFESLFTRMEFPNWNNGKFSTISKNYYEYSGSMDLDLGSHTSLSGQIINKLDNFPLSETTFGRNLVDFQTIFIPNYNLQPYKNKIYTIDFDQTIYSVGTFFIVFLKSQSNNLNNQYFENGFIYLDAKQLRSEITILSTTFEKIFKKIPLKITLEPELLGNSSEFISDNKIFETKVNRYLLGLKLDYKINENFTLFYYPKYSNFIFSQTNTLGNRKFDFFANNLNLKFYFNESKWLLDLNYRQVNFIQNKSDFNNLNIHLVYKTEKYRYFMNCNNLFNSKNFQTQDFQKSILNQTNSNVFGRFINFGFEFKIN